MPHLDRTHRLQLISSSGLVVVDAQPPPSIPTVMQAWQKVVNVQTEPTVAVSQDLPDALKEVDRQWLSQGVKNSLFNKEGEFLISVAGPGSVDFGWTRVRWSKNASPSSMPSQDENSPEFLGMSLDGRNICAVTTEEYDYWIVVSKIQ
ncbi:hypothetical protein SSP35_03_02210 [Streptomyces sp. NBRC 110611]|uniref:hypothetical protein n=1 Tax=Streptomyces sp. NBRC 110611 TaxID=1621259 RepID=UPI000855C5D1|nr:hypothetical protein [Streptomyces sp. NBRC 110611]GAU66573.1 hypothetical protein SSP35_03_02210 [Streptomyces sp. NBRC 110611]